MSFCLKKYGKNLWLGEFSAFSRSGLVTHAMTARAGGTSRGVYASFNAALHVGDDAAAVTANRRLLAEALGLQPERICTAEQVHGDTIRRVQASDAGRGAFAYADAFPATDALMTDVPGLPLLMCFADCVPVLLLDPVNRVVAVAHGGWKGTVLHIAAKTLARMGQEFGTKPADCLAAIGPSIGPCCFEVGPEVRAQFRASFPGFADKIISEANDAIHINLWEANRLQLMAEGMPAENIDVAKVCTCCNSETFYSYRADNGTTGRLAAVIALK